MKRQDEIRQLVKAINRQNVLIKQQNTLLEKQPEAIGKSTAKWLIKADLPAAQSELKVLIYLEMGLMPIEIVDQVYPNLTKSARRAKAQAISKLSNK